jgi:hypothetical protein
MAHAGLLKEVCFHTSLVAEPMTEVYPGFAVAANSANFPALFTGNGAMTVGVLGPWYVKYTNTFLLSTHEQTKAVQTPRIHTLEQPNYRSLSRVGPSTLNLLWKTVQERSRILSRWVVQQFFRE